MYPELGRNIQEATQLDVSEYKYNTNMVPNSLSFVLMPINFSLVAFLGMLL